MIIGWRLALAAGALCVVATGCADPTVEAHAANVSSANISSNNRSYLPEGYQNAAATRPVSAPRMALPEIPEEVTENVKDIPQYVRQSGVLD